jgi:hypothetical protein
MKADELKAISEIVKQNIDKPCPFVQSYWNNLKKHLVTQFEVVK